MIQRVHFIETSIFTKQILTLLDDNEFRGLQVALTVNPEAGDLIRGSGGLRKIRWATKGKGKSGGIRVIYYLIEDDEIYLLFAYPKSKQGDLTSEQLKVLKQCVQEELQ